MKASARSSKKDKASPQGRRWLSRAPAGVHLDPWQPCRPHHGSGNEAKRSAL